MPAREFRLIALARSGGHAVWNWILSGAPGPVWYANNLPPQMDPRKAGKTRGFARSLPSVRGRKAGLARAATIAHSHERFPLQKLAVSRPSDRDGFPAGDRVDTVILVRDVFNTLASYTAGYRRKGAPHLKLAPPKAAKLWVEYAREGLRETQLLGLRPGELVTLVQFDRWRDDAVYRDFLCRRLAIDPAPAALTARPRMGGGSTFRRQGKRPAAEELDSRFLELADDERYRSFFTDEVVRVNAAIFGEARTRAIVEELRL
jgi:hypothetical protein